MKSIMQYGLSNIKSNTNNGTNRDVKLKGMLKCCISATGQIRRATNHRISNISESIAMDKLSDYIAKFRVWYV